jgi:hypothetical protein
VYARLYATDHASVALSREWVQGPALLSIMHMSRQCVDVLMMMHVYDTHCSPLMVLSVLTVCMPRL